MNAQQELRIGVVGVGHLGSLHAKMLSDIPGVRLAAVYDADVARGEAVASQYGTACAGSLDALLDAVDAVTIATTTVAHADVALRALERGKHVFVEKPITETIGEAKALCEAASRRRLLLQVGHIERFNPAILALEKYTIAPMFVESHRLAQFNPRGTDVGVVLDLMIHDIDLILSFVRSPVRSVEANGVAVVSDSVDIANARIQFENGCVANVTASRISQRKMRKMRLFQKSGYISIDFSEGTAEVFRLVGEGEPEAKGTMMLGELGSGKHRRKIVYELPEVKEVNALRHELALFADAIVTGRPPVVSGEDGARALEVAGAIMEKISQQSFAV
ncbi:MAG TPA: Gfo/Idh/MocA family oxidoreductase [Bacteroidota bacterium]|nr:Gfo/Idh/MocA family oxidoreductase [Bacteroidota bacterium]